MKIIITESQLNEIVKSTEFNEIDITNHFEKRKDQRFLSNQLDVVISIPYQGTLSHTVVGTYIIPTEVKDEINSKIDHLIKTKIDRKATLGVILYKFNKIKASDIRWTNDKTRSIAIKLLQDNYKANLYVSDKITDSTGDMLFAIVQDNSIITMTYERKYGLETNRKMKYDEIITDMEQLEKYKVD